MAAKIKALKPATMMSPGQLHDAVLNTTDEALRLEIQFTHSEITAAMAAFMDNPTTTTLRKLNGHWAHGAHVLGHVARRNRERATQ